MPRNLLLNQGHDVAIVDLFLLIRQNLELVEDLLQLFRSDAEAERAGTVRKSRAATVFPKHQVGFGKANIFGSHDFIRAAFLEHSVLVNARFVRECVASYDGFVALHFEASDLAEQRLVGTNRSVLMPVVQWKSSWRVRRAMTISSSAQLPARSPIPLMVHSTCPHPAATAASELAKAKPRSSWQCVLRIALSILGTRFISN